MSLATLDIDGEAIGRLLQLPADCEIRGLSLVDRYGSGDLTLRLFIESYDHDGPLSALYDIAECGHLVLNALQPVQ